MALPSVSDIQCDQHRGERERGRESSDCEADENARGSRSVCSVCLTSISLACFLILSATGPAAIYTKETDIVVNIL